MCLSLAVHRPEDVLATGTHESFDWVVIKNPMLGFRCGYVRVSPGHPWHGQGHDDVSAEVHGGLTFAEADLPCTNATEGKPDNGWWLGFDCGHAWDAQDRGLVSPAFCSSLSNLYHHMHDPGNTLWTQEMVEAECRSLCDQAAAAVSPATTVPG